MSDPTHGWCPRCREESAIDYERRCLWCGGPTEQREKPKKRGGWKRPDKRAFYTEAQLRALHVFHTRDGISINELAKRTYEVAGYKSHKSAVTSISAQWRKLGLQARDRIEATVKASTKHGLAPKHGPRPGYGTYKRRVLHGEADQPICEGVRLQPPRKGEPCVRPAMKDSRFCFSHDPEWAEWRDLHLVNARAKQPKVKRVPLAPLSAWLNERYAELGTWRAVGEVVGRNGSLAHTYARGLDTATKRPKETIGQQTAEALLGEETFAAVYSPAASYEKGGVG